MGPQGFVKSFSVYFYYSNWVNSVALSSNSQTLSSPHYVLSYPVSFLVICIWLLHFSVIYIISVWYFFKFYFFAEIFYILSLFFFPEEFVITCWSIFMVAALLSLSDSSSIWFISVLTSVDFLFSFRLWFSSFLVWQMSCNCIQSILGILDIILGILDPI